jgi:hypothetical protein
MSWQATGNGSSRVRMEESFVQGPALAFRNRVGDMILHARNAEALARLEHLTRKYLTQRPGADRSGS